MTNAPLGQAWLLPGGPPESTTTVQGQKIQWQFPEDHPFSVLPSLAPMLSHHPGTNLGHSKVVISRTSPQTLARQPATPQGTEKTAVHCQSGEAGPLGKSTH